MKPFDYLDELHWGNRKEQVKNVLKISNRTSQALHRCS